MINLYFNALSISSDNMTIIYTLYLMVNIGAPSPWSILITFYELSFDVMSWWLTSPSMRCKMERTLAQIPHLRSAR
jgi:hypothetical protein